MVKFVETKEVAKEFFAKYENTESILFPIFKNRTIHPIKNHLLGVFVFIENDCWVLMNGHNDCISINLALLERGSAKKYIFDTKWLLHKLNLQNWKSVDVSYHLSQLETYKYDMIYTLFTSGYHIKDDLSFVPITVLLRIVTEFVEENSQFISDLVSGFDRYNDFILPAFLQIEKNGIPTKNGIEYSLYNNFTTTGRPTNTFGGVNYSALNKSDGTRDEIISKLGEFYQYDYDGYHVRLISKLINVNIPEPYAHEWLGKQYFGKDLLTDEEYHQSKAITFRQLYGGIDIENLDIKFYEETNRFVIQLYKKFLKDGYIETKFGKRITAAKIDNHNPQKVFNYYLQALETETNVMIITQLNDLLREFHTKLVLYTYDSFLFDLDLSELSIIPEIERILFQVAPTELSKNRIYGKI